VGLGWAHLDPQGSGFADGHHTLCDRGQALGRDAGPVHAVAARRCLLDEGDRSSQLGAAHSGGKAARAGANDD
jgi:hypothetical protein